MPHLTTFFIGSQGFFFFFLFITTVSLLLPVRDIQEESLGLGV